MRQCAKPMFCVKCGKVLNPGAKFCSGCGTPVRNIQTSQVESLASHRCESCGAMMSQVAVNLFVCDYCGSQWVPKENPAQPVQTYQSQPAVSQKDAEDEFLDAILAAAKRFIK